nr:hypothetical protein [Chitinophagaceae bacterium]
QTALVIMTNNDNGESIFKELLAYSIGDTFTPWLWQNYIPYDYVPPPVVNLYSVSPTDLDRYAGVYSSSQLPVKITVFKNNLNLVVQATGQQALTLQAIAINTFRHADEGIILEFMPVEKTMLLKQNGQVYHFIKE